MAVNRRCRMSTRKHQALDSGLQVGYRIKRLSLRIRNRTLDGGSSWHGARTQIHRSPGNQTALFRMGRGRQARPACSSTVGPISHRAGPRSRNILRPLPHRRAGFARPRRIRQTANRLPPARFHRRYSPADQEIELRPARLRRPFLGRQHRHDPRRRLAGSDFARRSWKIRSTGA